jgi:hypothetical protein
LLLKGGEICHHQGKDSIAYSYSDISTVVTIEIGWGNISEVRILDLEKEAKRCGGVVAAILSNLRKIRKGDRIRINASDNQVRELSEALDLFLRYGLIQVINKVSDREVIIEKIK